MLRDVGVTQKKKKNYFRTTKLNDTTEKSNLDFRSEKLVRIANSDTK